MHAYRYVHRYILVSRWLSQGFSCLSLFMSSLCHVTLIVSFLLSFLTFHLSMYVDFKPKRPSIIPSLLTVCRSFLATTYFQSINLNRDWNVLRSLHIPQLFFILPTFHGFKLAFCLQLKAEQTYYLLTGVVRLISSLQLTEKMLQSISYLRINCASATL